MLSLVIFLLVWMRAVIEGFDKCFSENCVDEVAGCAYADKPYDYEYMEEFNISVSHSDSPCRRSDAYIGFKNTTLSGHPCLWWDDPHVPPMPIGRYPHNYCRNPTNMPAPFCYYDQSQYEPCFPECCPADQTPPPNCVPPSSPGETTSTSQSCEDTRCVQQNGMFALNGSPECMNYSEAYLGTKNISATNTPCIPWKEGLSMTDTIGAFGEDMYSHNYCRLYNPNEGIILGPWCYTSKGKELCFRSSSITGKCGNCLDNQHGRGCDIRTIQACVCERRRECCTTDWDVNCVEEVASCGCIIEREIQCDNCLDTAHGPGCNNPVIQSCVCAKDPHCCNENWDSDCVLTVTHPSRCNVSCGLKNCGDCLTTKVDKGCSNKEIESCVCTIDPFCCNNEWDENCVKEVKSFEWCWRGGCVNPAEDKCGNGIIDEGEECDDGNYWPQDGCSLNCKKTTCAWTVVNNVDVFNNEDSLKLNASGLETVGCVNPLPPSLYTGTTCTIMPGSGSVTSICETGKTIELYNSLGEYLDNTPGDTAATDLLTLTCNADGSLNVNYTGLWVMTSKIGVKGLYVACSGYLF